eukprot:2182412-Amphidinium_carterae.1
MLAAYASAGIERKKAKATKDEPDGVVWGAHLRGSCRRVESPAEKRHLLISATLEACRMSAVPPRLIQVLCGHWQHHLAFHRSSMCVLDMTYSWLRACEHGGKMMKRKPPLHRKVRDELLLLCVFAPLFHTQLDRPMADKLLATDATIKKGAVCVSTLTSASQAGFLWRAADFSSFPMQFIPAVLRTGVDPLAEPAFE